MESFTDPYKKFYETLKNVTFIAQESETVATKISDSSKLISSLKSALSDSGWKELGIETLSNTTIPNLITNIATLESNIETVLKVACTKAVNELLPELEKLKTESENFDSINSEIENLVVPVSYDKDNEETAAYREYMNKKIELTRKLEESRVKREEYKRNCDTMISTIKALDGNIKDFPKKVSTSKNSDSTTVSIVDGSENGKLIKVNFNGTEFYVVNTKNNVFDYEKYVQKIGAYQNAGYMGSRCDLLSQQIAVDLLKGTNTSKSIYADSVSGVAMRITHSVRSQNKDDVLKFLYQEVNNGRPVVLQVTQKRSNEGLRHFVTVVGFDSTVSSYKDLTPEKILVMDCVDGKVQTLSARNRNLFNQGGKGYLATGATQEFLAKEVYKTKNTANA